MPPVGAPRANARPTNAAADAYRPCRARRPKAGRQSLGRWPAGPRPGRVRRFTAGGDGIASRRSRRPARATARGYSRRDAVRCRHVPALAGRRQSGACRGRREGSPAASQNAPRRPFRAEVAGRARVHLCSYLFGRSVAAARVRSAAVRLWSAGRSLARFAGVGGWAVEQRLVAATGARHFLAGVAAGGQLGRRFGFAAGVDHLAG